MTQTTTSLQRRDTEALEQRVYRSARWCNVGLSLLILTAGAVALSRLVLTGQP